MPAIFSLALIVMALLAAKQIPSAVALGVITIIGFAIKRRTEAAEGAIRNIAKTDRPWDAPSRAQMKAMRHSFAQAMRQCEYQTLFPETQAFALA